MGVLNFSTDHLITGVNIIEGNLYWTDNYVRVDEDGTPIQYNEPKKLEIDRFRNNEVVDGVTVNSNGDILTHTDITVIRPHPYEVITLRLDEYTPTTERPEPPFEKVFPRFSYRWRYDDGQYSTYAPFTQAAFLSQTRPATSDNDNYTEGFNTTLFNNVGRITLDNIPRGTRDVVAIDLLYTESISSTIYVIETLEIPEAQRGLDYIINDTSYVNRFTSSDTEQPVPQDGDFTLLPLKYEITARKTYRALPENQLLRHFDNVPRLAKAQEITANRLVYGNYLQNFNQPSSVNLSTQVIPAESFPYLAIGSPEEVALRSQSNSDGLHVKGNRTYEIGVAYIDPYGRQGAMIPAGSIIDDSGSVTEASSFTTPFNQSTRQALAVTINDEPPSWADSYRYFIKDVSQDHHNLIAYNIYNDGTADENMSPYVWAEFLSTDRNKILEDTVLIPRREGDDIVTSKQRHLVQDIENEAPHAVVNQIAQGPDVEYISLGRSSAGEIFSYRQDANWTGASLPPALTGSLSGNTIHLAEDAENADADLRNLGIARTIIYATINGFLAQNRLETLVENIVGLTDGTKPSTQSVAIPFDAPQQLYAQFGGTGEYYQVKRVQFSPVNAHVDGGEDRDVLSIEFYNSITANTSDAIQFFTAQVTEEAQERLQGRFWVRIARNDLTSMRSTFNDNGEINTLHQVWFETEPVIDDSALDLFWETSDTFCVCTEHGWPNKLNWFNCITENTTGGAHPGVYLESQRINNQFNSVQLVKGVRVNVPQNRYNEERRAYGLIWSGIFNSNSGVNRLNQFIDADGITKELEPNYGSLQKLHTRDTNVIAMCEDKIFSILSDKDLLFNADGGGNVSAANVVLGQTTPYVGEYGISTNPESFATYGNHVWFADKKRGVMIQFVPVTSPQTQLFEISSRGFEDFFRDRLFSTDRIIGMYDDYGDKYVASLQGYDHANAIIDPDDALPGEDGNATLGYEVRTEGWVSRYSYVPEAGITLNNRFYTFKNGQMWQHNSNTTTRNNFYGTQYNSEVEVVFNDNPSAVKEFLTLGYEGTSNWIVAEMDPESSSEIMYDPMVDNFPFIQKEGKFFKPIVTMEPVYAFNDAGELVDSGNTREKSGIKGFYNVVRLRNEQTDKAELFAINTENYISSN